MESGLEDRNNPMQVLAALADGQVSMESGLEDRNNDPGAQHSAAQSLRLNGVRPRRPEQSLTTATLLLFEFASQWSPA